MSVIVSRMVSGVAGQAFWYLAGPLAPPSVWKRATAPTWLARLGAPGGSPRHRRGSPSLRGLSDPCPPSARAVPVLSSPSLPTTAHPVLAPTTTYHPPHIQVGSFSQNSSPPCRHSLGRPTELPGSSPFQSDPARRRRAAPLLRPPIYNPHSRSADQEVPLRQTMTVAGQLEEAKLGIN